jgi:hypothetical protein
VAELTFHFFSPDVPPPGFHRAYRLRRTGEIAIKFRMGQPHLVPEVIRKLNGMEHDEYRTILRYYARPADKERRDDFYLAERCRLVSRDWNDENDLQIVLEPVGKIVHMSFIGPDGTEHGGDDV